MSIVCLWSPLWQTAGEPVTEHIAPLLELVPRAASDAQGVLWADARGLPATRTATALRERLGGDAEQVRAGVAAVPVAAEAAARAGDQGVTVIPPGGERDFLAPLPLAVLGPEPRLSALMDGTGVLTCGALAALDRASVEARFGGAGAVLWRRSRADDPRLLFAPIPPEAPHASIDFLDYTVRNTARLVFAIHALLGSICDVLAARGDRAREIVLEFALAGGGVLRHPVRLARPTAERARWTDRVRSVLDTLTLPDSVTGIAIRAEDTEAASGKQGDLFDGGFASESAVEEVVARLTDSQGPVFLRPEINAHPLAEARTLWHPLEPAAVADAASPAAVLEAPPVLALQLLPEPRRVGVEADALEDHLRPVRIRDEGRWRSLVEAAGPDRISGGHGETEYAREYFRCQTEDGQLLWLFRDARRDAWYVQGWWD